MFDRSIYLLTFFVYTALCGVLLTAYDAGPLVVSLCLTILPLIVLWWVDHLHTRLIPVVLLVTLGVTLILEVIAYMNGLWYDLAPWNIRVFGMVPLESLVASFAHILLFIVAYEFWFDDRKASKGKHPSYTPYVLGLAGGLLALAAAYVYLFSGVFFTQPFSILILVGLVGFFAAVALAHRSFVSIMKKAAWFAVSMLPVTLAYEYVVIANELRFFANINEYLYTFVFFGQTLPAEEVVLLLAIPFWTAVVYELYLDDGQ